MRFKALIPFTLFLSACSARQSDSAVVGDAPVYGPDYSTERISLPFLVDDHYVPSGCMGDCATSVSIDSNCPKRGSDDAQGECHHFVFTAVDPAQLQPNGWAGVLWQTTEKNWGSLPGRSIAAGATGLHFYAAGAAGGEKLDILVGGLVPGDNGKACASDDDCSSAKCTDAACSQAHRDSLDLVSPLVLTTDFVKVEIPFGKRDYGSEVLSGFGWTAQMPAGTSRIEFYVDDLRWE